MGTMVDDIEVISEEDDIKIHRPKEFAKLRCGSLFKINREQGEKLISCFFIACNQIDSKSWEVIELSEDTRMLIGRKFAITKLLTFSYPLTKNLHFDDMLFLEIFAE